MGGGITQPGTAELDRRAGDAPPERPDGRGDPQLDPGPGVPAQQIVHDDPLDRFHRLLGDPVSAHLMRPERLGRQPVGIQAAGPHPLEPIGLHDVDPAGGALAEESLAVFSRRRRGRPDASSRAVSREPEHRRVTGIDRPDQRPCLGIGGGDMRPEQAERGILAEVPQGERALPRIPRRCLAGQQVFRIVRVHHAQSPIAPALDTTAGLRPAAVRVAGPQVAGPPAAGSRRSSPRSGRSSGCRAAAWSRAGDGSR